MHFPSSNIGAAYTITIATTTGIVFPYVVQSSTNFARKDSRSPFVSILLYVPLEEKLSGGASGGEILIARIIILMSTAQ